MKYGAVKYLVNDSGHICGDQAHIPELDKIFARLVGRGMMHMDGWCPGTEYVIYAQEATESGNWELIDGEELYPEDDEDTP